MAVVQKTSSSRRTIVLFVLLGIVGAVAFWMFYGRSPDAVSVATGESAAVSSASVNPVIDRELFRDPRFTALKVYAKLPVEVGSVGRSNPFARIGQ